MKEISDCDFDREVLVSELPVFACFTNEQCHSCYPTCLFAGQLVSENEGKFKFVRLDIEKKPEIAERYNVIAVPTILIFQKTRPVKKLIGFHDRKSLRALVDSVINETDRFSYKEPVTGQVQS